MAAVAQDYLRKRPCSDRNRTYETVPDVRKLQNFPRNQHPRFMFRTFHDSSRESNIPPTFTSCARHKHDSINLSVYDPLTFPRAAHAHLTNGSKLDRRRFNSLFISVTPALLVALSWGYFNHLRGRKGMRLVVFDTHKLSNDISPIFPATFLRDLVNDTLPPSSRLDPKKKKWVNEYDVWDQFTCMMCSVDFESMETAGLITYLPEFGIANAEHKFPGLINILYGKLFKARRRASVETTTQAITLARLPSTKHFYVPVLAAFLTIFRRHHDEHTSLVNTLLAASGFGEDEHTEISHFLIADGEYTTSSLLGTTTAQSPDMDQYVALVDRLCQKLTEEQKDTKSRKQEKTREQEKMREQERTREQEKKTTKERERKIQLLVWLPRKRSWEAAFDIYTPTGEPPAKRLAMSG